MTGLRRLVLTFCALIAALTGAPLLVPAPSVAASGRDRAPGEAARPHQVHAFVNATLVVAPGRTLENATLVIRDGKVAAVGNVAPPADARVWDMKGRTLHAGFVDPYLTASRLEGRAVKDESRRRWWEEEEEGENRPRPQPQAASGVSAASHPNSKVHAEVSAADSVRPDAKALEDLRAAGIVACQAAPDTGIFRGQAALYFLGSGAAREMLVRDNTAAVMGFATGSWDDDTYPSSGMGNVALIRQTFLDARWLAAARAVDRAAYRGSERPAEDRSLEALAPVVNGSAGVIAEAKTLLEALRWKKILDEAGIHKRVFVLSGEEWRRLDWVDATLKGGADAFILPVHFPKAPTAEEDDEWLDVDLLTLERWKNAPANPVWLARHGITFSFTTHRLKDVGELRGNVRKVIAAGMPESDALAALTTRPAALLGLGDRLGTLEVGKSASFVVLDGPVFGEKSRVLETWVEGERFLIDKGGKKDKGGWGKGDEEGEGPEGADAPKPDAEKKDDAKPADEKETKGDKKPKSPLEPFEASDYAREPAAPFVPFAPGAVLVKNATVWTQGPQGTLEHADVLVEGGKVKAVGTNLAAPAGAHVVDGTGLHVTPGIIDAHSHTGVDGDVNEGTHNVTCEVRIKDVLDPFDRNIYFELAGGTTVANVMHGSANAIGGQVITCKWRWGATPDGLVFGAAPEGVKFALGENPKQSNWGDRYTTRYPQTRMGVAELIRERFIEAGNYRKAWQQYEEKRRLRQAALAPRRDLQLDALLEVLDGKRLIQCHSYRQDEILMLIRVADEQGFKVKTFQHVLEGYKVADEIAAHGAGASSFSDWWAYKMEVMDAIPWNGAILQSRGVPTSFNSDSGDLARRLNTDAAKAVRYGSLDEKTALDFVTKNPAIQLGIENRVGTLEVGKDGDFVVWSDHPLSQYAVCLQTWIDGKRYFSVDEDRRMQADLKARRDALVEKAKEGGKGKKGKGGPSKEEKKPTHRDEFCIVHGHEEDGE